MSDLTDRLRNQLVRALADYNVTLLGDGKLSIGPNEPSAIVSGLTHVRYDTGGVEYRGRRRKLTLGEGDESISLLVRTRPLPDEPEDGWLMLASARDRHGRDVPICAVEWATGTIRVLMDLSRATMVGTLCEDHASHILARTIFREPLSCLLRKAPPPRVGEEIPRQVRRLLERRPIEQRVSLHRELSMLRSFAPPGRLPGVLARRLEALKRLVSEKTQPAVTDDRVDLEVSRLTKLVASRAVAALRLGPSRIEGLLNPAPLDAEWRLRSLMFRLQLGNSPMHPILHTWIPSQPGPGGTRANGHCLGEAEPVLHELDSDGDLFSVVDTVINFRETNHLQARPILDPLLCVPQQANLY